MKQRNGFSVHSGGMPALPEQVQSAMRMIHFETAKYQAVNLFSASLCNLANVAKICDELGEKEAREDAILILARLVKAEARPEVPSLVEEVANAAQ